MQQTVFIYKLVGETPLEALERFRRAQMEMCTDSLAKKAWQDVPMTYAGRLDPMAEGVLLILIGDECKNKEKYLNLQKEYEVEILLGISTDTYDVLGLVTNMAKDYTSPAIDFSAYVGQFSQLYPPYSSKTVEGKQLHELARSGELPEDMPQKDVEIYSIDVMKCFRIPMQELLARIDSDIDLVNGDFRQKEIKDCWKKKLSEYQEDNGFEVITLRVKCSSGTYMRSLAHRIGQDVGCGAIALSIKRTKVFGL